MPFDETDPLAQDGLTMPPQVIPSPSGPVRDRESGVEWGNPKLADAIRHHLLDTQPPCDDDLRIIDHRPYFHEMTELLTVVCEGGQERTLFWKRDRRSHEALARLREHGGVPYEIRVYRHLLGAPPAPFPGIPTPLLACYEPTLGEYWLVIEFVENALHLSEAPPEKAVSTAGRWFGRFHRLHSEPTSCRPAGIRLHDPLNYQEWVTRTLSFARPMLHEFPWMVPVGNRTDEAWELLASSKKTLFHGEAYPRNILIADGQAHVIDWETAAFGPGELDLAAMVEGWRDDYKSAAVDAYCTARWPTGGVPDRFVDRLEAAHLFLQFRWLGESRKSITQPRRRKHFPRIRDAAERLGFL